MGRHVSAGSLDIWTEQVGGGPDVLLIGGLGDTVESWQFQLDGLADRYRLAAFDNRGAGRTSMPPGPVSVEQMADDAAAVLEALPADLVDRLERQGWLLLRSYNDEIGAPWPEAFGTADRGAVEAYCRANGIDVEWQPDGGLRTRQRRSAVVRHPVTGRRCWFNQVAFLNEWTLAEEVREYLVDVYGPDGLPFTTAFGDGEPIGEDVVALLNSVYERHTAREPWQDGDLLLVDNVRTAHSREAYTGPREVLVALADPVHLADCSPTVPVGTR